MSRVRENLIRKLVRELIKQELDEANSTASVGGEYQTPHSFKGSNKKGKKKGKAGYEGGHREPTDGTGHFIADDPKLRKESVNEGQKRQASTILRKFDQAYIKFSREVRDVIKMMNRSTGEKTDGRIVDKAYSKHLIPFDDLIQSWGRGQQENPHINEGRYHAWRNDESLSPKQKIGLAMRETRDNLKELERMVQYNVKLKNELKVDSRDYWKTTHNALSKISERLVRLANKVGQLH